MGWGEGGMAAVCDVGVEMVNKVYVTDMVSQKR